MLPNSIRFCALMHRVRRFGRRFLWNGAICNDSFRLNWTKWKRKLMGIDWPFIFTVFLFLKCGYRRECLGGDSTYIWCLVQIINFIEFIFALDSMYCFTLSTFHLLFSAGFNFHRRFFQQFFSTRKFRCSNSRMNNSVSQASYRRFNSFDFSAISTKENCCVIAWTTTSTLG